MKTGVVAIALFFGLLAYGQEQPSTSENSDGVVVADTGHSVRKAVLLSMIVPTAGQIYNHMAQPKGRKNGYWKVPLFLGALGFTSYQVVNQHSNVLTLRNEYRQRENGMDGLPQLQFYDDNAILQLEKEAAAKRDQFILLTVLSYGLQIADAGVEAHFVNFDVSEDLSMRLQPQYFPGYIGMGIQLNFR